ncbi:hypothetical protein SAMN05428984_4313 [Sphingomonas sp. OK281]|nr:hypothetical protein SAMN05428984_4313 [Sphingomonas sp. OK281]
MLLSGSRLSVEPLFSLAAKRKALTCDNCQESRASDDTSFKGCAMVISDLALSST